MNDVEGLFVGSWSYRSFLNDPDLQVAPNDLLFGSGTIQIMSADPAILVGTIGGPGWQLALTGSRSYGNPMEIRFQGKGVVGGAEWIYDYVGWLVPAWPNGVNQKTAMVGSIVRAIPHPTTSPDGKTGTAPAGVVASWYAVKH
ncbi:hypothetical protein [Tahibacter amnicola]|uniref:Uncharacterized protein n=1 Tax=Tahibacter amnicola TaxID=2976241 RepID=A0ABY6BIC5_9GAMM|nr:hypothetical protein [Tahibacter amnicola]UXI69768.1 hypothetical protein N4264_09095 [Tahibacter amnicola]